MPISVSINERLLPYVKTADFLYGELPDYDGGREKIILTMDMIEKYDQEYEDYGIKVSDICKGFLSSLIPDYHVSHEVNDNFLAAFYNEDNLDFFGRPLICKLQDQLELIIGSESKEEKLSYTALPLTINNQGVFVNDTKLGLDSIEIKTDSGSERYPIAVFSRDIFDEFDREIRVIYSISIRLNSDTNYYDFKDAWESGDISKLSEMVAPLYGASCSISHMFSQYFISETFPKNGVVLKLTDVRLLSSDYNGKVLKSALYTVDSSGLPDIDVISTEGKNSVSCKLSEVTGIFVGSNHTAYIPVDQGKRPTPDNPWFLYIQGQGRSPNEVPKHQIFTRVLPPRIRRIYESFNAGKPIEVPANVARQLQDF